MVYSNNFLTNLGRSPAGPGNFLFTVERQLTGVTGREGVPLLCLLLGVIIGVELFNTDEPDTELVIVLINGLTCVVLFGVEGTEQCVLVSNDRC